MTFLISLIRRALLWLWQIYVGMLVCLHFCAFKRAGSTLKYTHVHILPKNADGATGLGHDDETNTTDKAHASVSKGGECKTQAEDDSSMALRKLGYLGTAYFHPADASGECEEGFTRVKCRCGEEDVWVCYTMDHDVFERWYDEQKWPNRTGHYAYPATPAALVDGIKTGPLACGTTIVIEQFAIESLASCAGYGGAADGENSVVKDARAKLQVAYDKITCVGPCTKSYTETFKGWRCGKDTPTSTRFMAEAKVQWTVRCA